MTQRKIYKTLVASSIHIALLSAGLAYAQESEEESNNEGGIEIIQVTSTKRVKSINEIPLSVTAVSGETLLENGVTDLTRLDALTPGLQFGQSGTDARPAIRGARTENVSVQQDPVIGFFVDGVYRSRTSQALASFVDVSRVEVLRGPQGTLFGRNTFGGAISVISNQPTDSTEYGADITIGNFDRRRIAGYANAPLADNLFFRVSASIDNHDPIIENTFNPDGGLRDKDEDYLRLQLKWEASDTFDVTLRASSWNQGGRGNSDFGYFVLGTPTDLDNDGSLSLDEALNGQINPINPRNGAGGVAADTDPYRIARDFVTSLDTEQETFDIEANWDLDWATAKVILSYTDFETTRDADSDLSINNSAISGQFDTVETLSQEFQLNSQGNDKFEWTVGAFFLQDESEGIFFFDRVFATDPDTNTPQLDTPAPTSDFNARAIVDTDSIAFYGQGTYSLTDDLRLTGGLRWTRDEKEFTRFVNFAFTQPLSFSGDPSTVDEDEFSAVTWRVGLDYDINDKQLIYFTASTGFQSGGFNNNVNSAVGTAAFDEQEITAYEIGSKNQLLNGNMVLNIAAYLNEFDDLLAQEFVDVGSTVVSVSTNAGEATVFGIEAELDWTPTDEILLQARAAFNDSEFGQFLISEPVSGEVINLDGGRVPLTPDVTFSLSGQYVHELENGTITPAFTASYSSDYSTNDIDYNFGEQDDFLKLDVRLTYKSANDDWYVELFGRNITDEEIINRTVRFGQNAIVQNFDNPATYGVRFGFNY
ncbi:TonB-dependent receptor [Alteromonadaceae bacterium M269]|nr:TonB-dependent receptor [Alteromonadaceae bacterium M269]